MGNALLGDLTDSHIARWHISPSWIAACSGTATTAPATGKLSARLSEDGPPEVSGYGCYCTMDGDACTSRARPRPAGARDRHAGSNHGRGRAAHDRPGAIANALHVRSAAR